MNITTNFYDDTVIVMLAVAATIATKLTLTQEKNMTRICQQLVRMCPDPEKNQRP